MYKENSPSLDTWYTAWNTSSNFTVELLKVLEFKNFKHSYTKKAGHFLDKEETLFLNYWRNSFLVKSNKIRDTKSHI